MGRCAAAQRDLEAWRLVLPPSGRFTHLTAARLLGWWLPPLPADLPVFAGMSESESRPRREGLVVARHAAVRPPTALQGLPVDPIDEVLLACARDCSLLDTVVLLDAALHLGQCSLAELHATSHSRRRGAPRLRQALVLADGRSESAWETLLRVLHVVCDVPVEPQYRLVDGEDRFVARADLWIRGTTALHEYDGEHHLLRPQQRKDLLRARRINNEAWVRRGYTSREVLHQAVTIIRDADLSLGREHRPERVRPWHRMLADSLFTGSGRQRFRCRFGLGSEETGHRRHLDAPEGVARDQFRWLGA